MPSRASGQVAGSAASAQSLLADYALTNVAAGASVVGSLASAQVLKGVAYQVAIVNADTTGELDVTIVIEPD